VSEKDGGHFFDLPEKVKGKVQLQYKTKDEGKKRNGNQVKIERLAQAQGKDQMEGSGVRKKNQCISPKQIKGKQTGHSLKVR